MKKGGPEGISPEIEGGAVEQENEGSDVLAYIKEHGEIAAPERNMPGSAEAKIAFMGSHELYITEDHGDKGVELVNTFIRFEDIESIKNAPGYSEDDWESNRKLVLKTLEDEGFKVFNHEEKYQRNIRPYQDAMRRSGYLERVPKRDYRSESSRQADAGIQGQ